MLDVWTILVVILVVATLQGVGFFVLHRTQPAIPGLRAYGTAFIIFAVGMALLSARGMIADLYSITLGNLLVASGHLILTGGLYRFFGKRRPRWLDVIFAVTFLLVFPLYVYLDPGNISLRVLISGFVLASAFLCMAWLLWQDDDYPRPLRWILIVLILIHSSLLVGRGIVLFLTPGQVEMVANHPLHALLFLETNVFMTFLFIGLVGLVMARTAADLARKNRELTAEIGIRQQLQEDLSASFAKESDLRQQQQHLLHLVGHEFRTPLAIIERATEMIGVLITAPPAAVAERLRVIQEAVRRQRLLIQTFLATERVEESIVQKEPLELGDLSREAVNYFASTGQETRIRLTAAPDALPMIGDTAMISTLFVNLLDNALKYSPADKPVQFALRREGDRAVATIADQGIGIPAAEREHIGQRFFRASNTSGRGGTGLGLHTAMRIVELHDGTMRIDSKDGQGTMIEVSLPIAQPEAGVPEAGVPGADTDLPSATGG
ncbi:sensor histidine kinase [Oceanibaculum sp.]|uniref:sensor histidine kinase n=1 Tax=Oceanibaculum sp. TaxID=1903597 RepID=UPI00258506D5|nr:HAMP domain-containing sensor histidine kinase [Oceanibaculum sp.]MCH2394075.1 HAMP domain-containing histidine kinase [Oceanibaculum sp.]